MKTGNKNKTGRRIKAMLAVFATFAIIAGNLVAASSASSAEAKETEKRGEIRTSYFEASPEKEEIQKSGNEIAARWSRRSTKTNYIGTDAALAKALAHAGLKAGDVTVQKNKLERDDGIYKYDIEFKTADKEYDYEINALTGAVMEYDVEVIKTSGTGGTGGGSTQTNYIGTDAALAKALAHAGLKAGDVTVQKNKLQRDDGIYKYDIEFKTADKEYDYEINALTGAVIEYDVEAIKTGSGTGGTGGGSTQTNYIGTDAALAKALTHAGLKASDVTVQKNKLERDDGIYKYDIEFKTADKEYDYEINALTGAVIEYDVEIIKTSGTGTGGGSTQTEYIGTDAALKAALKRAGVKEADIRGLSNKLEKDDGVWKYEIEFKVGNYEYEIEVDALSGKILDYDREYDD